MEEITREEAERRYVAWRQKEFARKFRAEAAGLCDEDLEHLLGNIHIVTDRSD